MNSELRCRPDLPGFPWEDIRGDTGVTEEEEEERWRRRRGTQLFIAQVKRRDEKRLREEGKTRGGTGGAEGGWQLVLLCSGHQRTRAGGGGGPARWKSPALSAGPHRAKLNTLISSREGSRRGEPHSSERQQESRENF